jgi:predicted Zn-ribbon and HTH transcriptional regulator
LNNFFPVKTITFSISLNQRVLLSLILKIMGYPKWTLERFLMRAVQIHGEKYDYNKISPDHINGYRSKVSLTCKTCFYEWSPSIDDHINSKSGCPSCKGVARWTLERFLSAAVQIHGEKYNYSLITAEHIGKKTSKVPIVCNVCSYQWEQQIAGHINSKQGCPNCAGNVPWSTERFLQRAFQKYQYKFKYPGIENIEIIGECTFILAVCQICGYNWNTTIDNFINKRQDCPDCNGHAHWNLHRFLLRA